MKNNQNDKTNIKYGFVGAGYSPIAGRLIYSTHAQMYLHIIRIKLKDQNIYKCISMNAFNKEKIPIPYNQHEFTEFYGDNPPKISNNKEKAVNQLFQSQIVN